MINSKKLTTRICTEFNVIKCTRRFAVFWMGTFQAGRSSTLSKSEKEEINTSCIITYAGNSYIPFPPKGQEANCLKNQWTDSYVY